MPLNINRLKDMIQDSNINFLFGSGMSAPYLNTLGKIESLLTDLSREDCEIKNEANKKIIISSLYKKFFDDVIDKNLDILNENNDSRTIIDNYKTFFEKLNSLILKRKNKLLSKQINIFTTNIDICLEKAIEEKNFECNDGFNGRFKPQYDLSNFKKSLYKTSLHYENSSEIPVFNIMKIHGSLTWMLNKHNRVIFDSNLTLVKNIKEVNLADAKDFILISDDDNLATLETKINNINCENLHNFIAEYNKLAIVNPTKDKFRDTIINQIYYDLLRIYANELEKENTILFVMGFSFADEHIRELTLRVANSNPTLIIYIFAYTNEAKTIIEHNIDMNSVKNSNIFIIAPEILADVDNNSEDKDDKCETDAFKYDFATINQKIFEKLLAQINGNIADE